ncbi:MAG: leucine-rich repeat domain-containing protein [Bacteroidaceae bacterium]|nr:leucine-rich repeat domain-containing protein [Bacteroidaceae bacterium]
MIRKMKACLAIVVLLLSSISASAVDFIVDGIYYNVTSYTDKTVEVANSRRLIVSTNTVVDYEGSIIIPESITRGDELYRVTGIASDAFSHCRLLESVSFPNSITNFVGNLFDGCYSLTSITFSDSFTSSSNNISIGNEVFKDCSSLKNVTFPNSLVSIGESAFRGCSALTSITFPNSLVSIGESAFRGCI